MSCRGTGKRLLDRELGLLTVRQSGELSQHLLDCSACADLAGREERLSHELVRLNRPAPFELDVRHRVYERTKELEPVMVDTVPSGQLGWAAACAATLALVLLSVLLVQRGEIFVLGGRVLSSVQAGLQFVDGLWRPSVALLGIGFGLLRQFVNLVSKAGPYLSSLSVLGTTALAAGYLFMSLTIFASVRRDFRQPPILATRKEP